MRSVLVSILLALPAAAAPKLGVFIIVDQLSAFDFAERLPKAKAGFKRLTTEGARIREVRYEAAPTVTAVGHATLSTGAYGEVHGIVANEWIDAESGKPVLSGEDSNFHLVGRPSKERDLTSPALLRAPTLGDSVRNSHDKAKTVTISGKDRSAILSAGRNADAVVWFDTEKPMFVTSDFYSKELPAFVLPINQAIAGAVLKGAFAWGLPGGGVTGQAPALPAVGRVGDSAPFADKTELQADIDRYEVDLALAAVKAYELGKDDVPDLLTISFSGHDRVGHNVGPESPVAVAEFENIDAQIGRLLEGLDSSVGKGAYVVVLAADHGVAPNPDVVKARGGDSGRVDTKALREVLEKEADAALGPADWIAGMKVPGPAIFATQRAKLLGISDRLRKVAREQPGVLDLWPMAEVIKPGAFGKIGEFYRRGYFPGRSPDFVVLTKPYWLYGNQDISAHSTAYNYDRTVPAVFFGAGVKPGLVESAEAIDLAPTMARLLGVPPPAAAQGHVLEVVVR